MMKKIIFYVLIFLAGCTDPDIPVVEITPVYAEPDPIALFLGQTRWPCSGDGCADGEAIDRIANSIWSASEKHDLSVPLLVGVLMVENPWLDTTAVSYAGAIGLYQVMPLHEDEWGCEGTMQSVDGSVCRGASVLSDMMQRYGNERDALLGYNGCRSTGCQSYHGKVVERSEQFSGLDS
jgi:hypothetical protein